VREAFLAQSDKSIVVPSYAGKRGHPVLLSWKHVRGLRNHPGGEGLNTYLRRLELETLELPVEKPDILTDLDTPEDYARLLQ
jgi:molybdenum cofactor cytidylyltransferase